MTVYAGQEWNDLDPLTPLDHARVQPLDDAVRDAWAVVKGLKRDSLLAMLRAEPVFWDDFARPDQLIGAFRSTKGSPSGHRYNLDGNISTNSVAQIVDHRQGWTDETTTGGVPIRILKTRLAVLPSVVAALAVQTTAGSTEFHNSVVGCCEVSFSDATGSVQFAVSPQDGTWILFITDHLGVGGAIQIVTVASGTCPVLTGVYSQVMRCDRTTSTVTVEIDGAVVGEVSDSRFAAYWGHFVGFQFRKPNSTDGVIRFEGVAAGAPADATTGIPGCVVLPGDVDTYIATNAPPSIISTPLTDLEVVVSAPALPAAGVTNILASRWRSTNGQNSQSWAVGVNNTAKPVCYVSLDGTTSTLLTGTVAMPAGLIWKFTYNHTTGDFKAYSSPDESTWTQVGATQTLGGGGSPYNPTLNVPIDIGGRDSSSTLVYSGPLSFVKLKSGIGGTTIAHADFTSVWSKPTWVDAYGNTWFLRGSSWSWRVTESAVQGLTADLAALNASIATSGSGVTPIVAIKSATTTQTSTTTLANDADLHVALPSTGTFRFEALITYDASTTGDVKMAFTVPSGATISWQGIGANLATASDTSGSVTLKTVRTSGDTQSFGALGSGTAVSCNIRGIVVMGGTAGNLQFQSAQQASDATATSIYARSFLSASRIDGLSSGSTSTITVNSQSGTAYTLVIGDAGALVRMTNASANTVTVPPNSSVAFPVGTVISVMQYGAGVTTFNPGSGVTIDSPGGNLAIAARFGRAELVQIATDEWALEGDLG